MVGLGLRAWAVTLVSQMVAEAVTITVITITVIMMATAVLARSRSLGASRTLMSKTPGHPRPPLALAAALENP